VELARNEHRCYSEQLEVENLNGSALQEAVDQSHSHLDRLRHQFELHLDDEQPVDKKFAFVRRQLLLQAVDVAQSDLLGEKVLVDFFKIGQLGQLSGFRHPHFPDDRHREHLLGSLALAFNGGRILAREFGISALEIRLRPGIFSLFVECQSA